MRYACLLALLVASGCVASGADLNQLRDGLSTAGAIGRTAQLAMASVTASADVAVCAAASTRCSAYPCTATATITLGDACPLPYGEGAEGTVTVDGSFSAADSATVTSTFVGAKSTSMPIVVVKTQSVNVSRSGDITTVTYTGQDVDTKSNTLAAQQSWTVTVDGKGSDDPTDDVITIDGVGQAAGYGADDVSVSGAQLTPACRLNPVAGTASVQKVSLTDITQDEITFHATCDGKADVRGSTGGTKSVRL